MRFINIPRWQHNSVPSDESLYIFPPSLKWAIAFLPKWLKSFKAVKCIFKFTIKFSMANLPAKSLERQSSTYTIFLSVSILAFHTLRNTESQCGQGNKTKTKIGKEKKKPNNNKDSEKNANSHTSY